MLYFSGDDGSKAYDLARQFAQKIGTLGVDGLNKQWVAAADDYKKASEGVEGSQYLREVDGSWPCGPEFLPGLGLASRQPEKGRAPSLLDFERLATRTAAVPSASMSCGWHAVAIARCWRS